MDYFYNDDYNTSRDKALILLNEAKEASSYTLMCKLYFLLGYISEYDDDFGMAIIYYLEGSRYGQISSDESIKKTVVSIHKNLGSILGDYKHYSLAYKFIDEGVSIARSYNLSEQVESLLNNKIHEYVDESKFKDALTLIDSVRLLFPNMEQERVVKLLNKEGVAFQSIGDTRKALQSYNQVLENKASYGLDVFAICSQNIGTILEKQGQMQEAIVMYQKSIEYSIEHNFDRWEFEGYEKIGSVYYNIGKFDSALHYFQLAENLIGKGDQDPDSYEIYQYMSNVYSSQNKYETALEYRKRYSIKLEEYIAVQNKINEDEKQYNIQLLTDRYYDLLAADMEQKETERLAKFGIGGTASFFMIILSIMVYRQRRTKTLLAREINELHLTSEV